MLNKRNRMLAAIGVAITVLSLAGCETSNTTKDQRSAGRALDDENITTQIKKSLEQEPAYKFNGVSVNTYAGIVQLSGFVETEGQKARAQEVAANVDGVNEVHNGISIKPAMPQATARSNTPRIYAEPQNAVTPSDSTPTNQNSAPQ